MPKQRENTGRPQDHVVDQEIEVEIERKGFVPG